MARLKKLFQLGASELGWLLTPRIALLNCLLRLLPTGAAGRLRSAAYRLFGFRVGARTLMFGPLTFSSPEKARSNLAVGEGCFLNAFVHVDATAAVDIGDGVSIGHHVVIVTADHEIGPPEFRAGSLTPKPVRIGSGAWIAARVTILPGVTIGDGAVVAAGAVVTRDVSANSLVAGVPARLIRELSGSELGAAVVD